MDEFKSLDKKTLTTVNIYLTFQGNCKEAFDYYRSVFGGEFGYVGTFAEMPTQEGMPTITHKMKDKIMHISLPISKETELRGSDTGGERSAEFKMGSNFAISASTESKAKADRIFKQLAAGGRVTMPLQNTFWGDYFGSLTDQFGINWMINFNEASAKR